MRKTAQGIMLAGFVFVFFALPFAGVDLLIDAVGFLLVWNGLAALQKLDKTFGAAPLVCLALVAVAAAQLFFEGAAAQVLRAVRVAGEVVLYWQMLKGFARQAPKRAVPLPAWLFWCGFAVCAAAGLLYFAGLAAPLPPQVVAAAQWAGRTAILGLLAVLVITEKNDGN